MKLHSPFGLGEIVITNGPGESPSPRSRAWRGTDEIGKIIAATFDLDGRVQYVVRLPAGETRIFMPAELAGDPSFNHAAELGHGYDHLAEGGKA
jgi:hypothetical protein